MDGRMERWKDRNTNRWTEGRAVGWLDGLKQGWKEIDRWRDGGVGRMDESSVVTAATL